MLKATQLIINQNIHRHLIRDSDLAKLFGGSSARRYGLVNKALKSGELIRLSRGNYILNNTYLDRPFSQAYIANRLISHSFITAESALSFHGWIPEHVPETISACAFGRKRKFETPLGIFSYYPSPLRRSQFFIGVESIREDKQFLYIASPLRAIIDLIYLNKIDKANKSFLIDSLRIEEELVSKIQKKDIETLMPLYTSKRVQYFLRHLNKETPNE